MSDLSKALAAIDAANAHDPDTSEGAPAAQLYGQRMSAELTRLFADASEPLQIAARGQHIERWVLKRADYPQGREGYLTWRRDLARHHANRVGEIMREAGYDEADAEAAGKMIRKEGIKRDVEVQALEDVICFVFLKWYFAPFSTTQDPDKMQRIVEKTARKMSAEGRARVLDEFELPDSLAAAFRA
ncbi:DUF4202 domain-containing protein [Sedimentitalea arenosa]|jgi:hypothetical protein|uniref:DUF4202 domain-containing protein n=1 Tax=Sedimentitalea arenosa TaxID=2798803 RepID=A0A8J7J8A0_9RHOB|nr:DUF4202 domain-containing protein [Arenibacterium arenosum]MBJ6373070.1 DUF4202 domain-containing protein [Arenibacterium arenosum]